KPQSVLISTLNIAMAPAANELKEFVLRPGRFTKYQADSAARKVLYKTTLERRPPSPFNSPVSAIAELFNQKAKRAYQFQKDFAAGEIEKFIDIRYNPQMVTKLTGLTGDSIGHFMYACPMPYDFARSATDLEIKMWVRSSFREWQKKQPKDSLAVKAEVKK
ncbi:MAG: hypothetical protein H7257_10655, partial [Taibaiella sp.]|nr:hypothetical protein [Taibaiella sp.]